MQARLLRFTLTSQMALGAVLGYWLSQGSLALTLLWALTLPLLMSLGTVLYSFIVSRPGESAASWWRALAGECVASTRIFMLRQPWAFAAPQVARHTVNAERIPVLLVHGFVCNYRVWDSLVPALRAQGHTVLAINLEPPFTSIDDYAVQVERAVQALRAATGQQNVALVAHSMGGLAVRAWMRRFDSSFATRVITLGTPHAGTRVPRWAALPNTQQMAWHSDWLAELAATETEALRCKFRIGISPQDNIVFPQRAQTLPGVVPRAFDGLGHLQLCTSAEVRHWVCQELSATP